MSFTLFLVLSALFFAVLIAATWLWQQYMPVGWWNSDATRVNNWADLYNCPRLAGERLDAWDKRVVRASEITRMVGRAFLNAAEREGSVRLMPSPGEVPPGLDPRWVHEVAVMLSPFVCGTVFSLPPDHPAAIALLDVRRRKRDGDWP